jgi:hypothetical protein
VGVIRLNAGSYVDASFIARWAQVALRRGSADGVSGGVEGGTSGPFEVEDEEWPLMKRSLMI